MAQRRNCTKGFECGNSCQQRGRFCSSNLGQDAQRIRDLYDLYMKKISGIEGNKSIRGTYKDVPTEPSGNKTWKVKPMVDGDDTTYLYNVGDNRVAAVASKSGLYDELDFEETDIEDVLGKLGLSKEQAFKNPNYDINWFVNSSTEEGSVKPVEGLSDSQAKKRIAQAAKNANMEALANIGEPTIIVATVEDDDGKGDSRLKLYKKAGYGDMFGDGSTVAAIKFAGKLFPINAKLEDDDALDELLIDEDDFEMEAFSESEGGVTIEDDSFMDDLDLWLDALNLS